MSLTSGPGLLAGTVTPLERDTDLNELMSLGSIVEDDDYYCTCSFVFVY